MSTKTQKLPVNSEKNILTVEYDLDFILSLTDISELTPTKEQKEKILQDLRDRFGYYSYSELAEEAQEVVYENIPVE